MSDDQDSPVKGFRPLGGSPKPHQEPVEQPPAASPSNRPLINPPTPPANIQLQPPAAPTPAESSQAYSPRDNSQQPSAPPVLTKLPPAFSGKPISLKPGMGLAIYLGAFILSLAIGIIAYQSDFGTLMLVLAGILWVSGSFAGIALMFQKKYLAQVLSWGCVFWLFLGWWLIWFILGLGPFIYAIALTLKPRRDCPFCKVIIPGDASRCPNCHADITPII